MKKFIICLMILFSRQLGIGMAQEKSSSFLHSKSPTYSQEGKISIRGIVLNEKGEPIEFANVALLKTDSTFVEGKCTKADGTFLFDNVTPCKYLLQMSYVGYHTACISCDPKTAIRQVLTPESIALNEATVTARRPVYKLQNGILETNVSQSLLSTLSNACEVLKQIPGIRLTEDGYTVFGKGTPVIYINNRRLQDLSELDRLSADNIKKIELINNPGAEYDANVKAVIRIYTLSKDEGVSTTLNAGIIEGRRTTHYEQINVNYNKSGLLLSGMLYYNHNASKRSQNTQYEVPSSSTLWLINSNSRFSGNGQLFGGNFSAAYDFNPKHSIGLSYEYFRTPEFHYNCLTNYTVKANNIPNDRTDYLSKDLQQSNDHRLNFYYQGSIGELHLDFTADIVKGDSHDRQDAEEISQTEGVRRINTFTRAYNDLYAAKLILTYPLWKGTLKSGADYSFIRRKDKFDNPQEILPITDSRIDEKKFASFAEYVHSFGKISAKTGLRFERTSSPYWEKGAYVPEQSRTYNNWCPNLSVDFPIGNAKASLSYTVKTNRPSFQLLRSSVSYNNRFIYEAGNPLLTPETNHDLQLSTLYRWIQFSFNYQYTGNAIEFMAKGYEGNPDVAVFTFGNFRKSERLNASLTLSPSIGNWKPELGVYFTQPFFKVNSLNGTKDMNRGNLYITWNNTFQLPRDVILSINADYQNEGNAETSLQLSYWGMDLGLRKSFLNKRLSVNIDCSDLWNTRRNSFMLFGEKLTYTKWNRPDSRKISLKISYRINGSNKNYKGTHVSEEDLQRL